MPGCQLWGSLRPPIRGSKPGPCCRPGGAPPAPPEELPSPPGPAYMQKKQHSRSVIYRAAFLTGDRRRGQQLVHIEGNISRSWTVPWWSWWSCRWQCSRWAPTTGSRAAWGLADGASGGGDDVMDSACCHQGNCSSSSTRGDPMGHRISARTAKRCSGLPLSHRKAFVIPRWRHMVGRPVRGCLWITWSRCHHQENYDSVIDDIGIRQGKGDYSSPEGSRGLEGIFRFFFAKKIPLHAMQSAQ